MKHVYRALALTAFAGLLATPAGAQMSSSDLYVRIDQLESQMRALTGQIEQLQFRNQQLETQLRRLLEDGARPQAAAPPPRGAAPLPPPTGATAALPPPSGGGRGDAFDPNQNPSAPGAPRALGAAPDSGYPRMSALPPPPGSGNPGQIMANEDVGLPGGRQPGAPLDLSTMAAAASRDPALAPSGPGARPAPPPGATASATQPPTQTPRDEYDLGYGYLLRKDYAQAEDTLRDFLKRYPTDRMAADAQFWLGESMFQRQNYRDAASAFLDMSKKYEKHAKAPDALLRLGQSLAALHERELACATLSEVARKYPRASVSVKQATEREQKRAGC
ncbi:MAG: tol-pal system protein YbgF [Proteobacteria bacterium]|nr:MAG: tol-pal system protein YbgF [Pseudomonadota bacterium]